MFTCMSHMCAIHTGEASLLCYSYMSWVCELHVRYMPKVYAPYMTDIYVNIFVAHIKIVSRVGPTDILKMFFIYEE